MIRTRLALPLVTAGILLLSQAAFAHVTVGPKEVNVAEWKTFSVGVPVEKDLPTVGLRLVIPSGLAYVMPNVKPGWKIEVKKDGDAVTEIIWSNGLIPGGQRDDFAFSAKAPSQASVIVWKAYQTYQDGSVVSWDHDPKVEQPKDAAGKNDFSKVGPYSETTVINDLKPSAAVEPEKDKRDFTPAVSLLALVISLIALAKSRRTV